MKVVRAVKGRVVDSPISNAKATFRELKGLGKGTFGEVKSQVLKGHPSGFTSPVKPLGIKRPTIAKAPLRIGAGLIDTGLGAVQRARSANRKLLRDFGIK